MPAMRAASNLRPSQNFQNASAPCEKRSRFVPQMLGIAHDFRSGRAGGGAGQLRSVQRYGRVRMEMRISDWFRSIILRWLGTDLREAALGEIIAAISRGEAALTDRLNSLTELHDDLVRQFGIQQAATQKQFADLRAIVTQLGEQAKQKPAVAGNMADVRRFMGEVE